MPSVQLPEAPVAVPDPEVQARVIVLVVGVLSSSSQSPPVARLSMTWVVSAKAASLEHPTQWETLGHKHASGNDPGQSRAVQNINSIHGKFPPRVP